MKKGKRQDKENFACDHCGGIFEKERSDDEVMKEYKRLLVVSGLPENEPIVAVVCEECWQENMPSDVIIAAEGQ